MRTFCCVWDHSPTTPFSSSSLMPPPAARSASSPTTAICGVLHKWVNYGKGWRPRWFVLHDGVLSYYKVHGPDAITLSPDTERGFDVIGHESSRIISRGISGCETRKPLGEIHLKVSSIRESKSDGKRFWLFTGTKRLHLRADTRQDRAAWTEALQAVKAMFPRMSNSELMAPVDTTAVVSTEKMRQRLAREGASEAAIRDSEQIVRNEFAALHKQLVVHKKKQWVLIDTLRHLEVHLINTRKRKQNALPVQNSSSISTAAHSSGL